jgi:GntR family transcriptional regulator, transcriptional repressor for pyruvate dehydrogenase complex
MGVIRERIASSDTGSGPRKAAHWIAADFREQIARGHLAEGEALPVETELVDQLGVSRGIVREALRILETEGLVEVRRGLGGGPRVRHPTIGQAAIGMGIYLQIGDVLVDDVWVARDRIIGSAVERLAEDRDRYDLQAVEKSIHALGDAVGAMDAYYRQLLEVGEVVVRVAGNRTEHTLVAALREILAAELETAMRSVVDVPRAVSIERDIVTGWLRILKRIKAGHARASRVAYDRKAKAVRMGLSTMFEGSTVVDVVDLLE